MVLGIAMLLALSVALYAYFDDRRHGKGARWSIAVFLVVWPWLLGSWDLLLRLGWWIRLGIALAR